MYHEKYLNVLDQKLKHVYETCGDGAIIHEIGHIRGIILNCRGNIASDYCSSVTKNRSTAILDDYVKKAERFLTEYSKRSEA